MIRTYAKADATWVRTLPACPARGKSRLQVEGPLTWGGTLEACGLRPRPCYLGAAGLNFAASTATLCLTSVILMTDSSKPANCAR